MRSPRSFAAPLFAMLVSLAAPASAGNLTVTRVVPTEATVDEEVELHGTGFGKGTRVFLAARELPVRILSTTLIRVSVPSGARSGPLVVQRRGEVATWKDLTIVRFHAPPEIVSFTPKRATVGTLLRIKGSGFGEENRTIYVSVGGAVAEVVERTREALLVRVPEDAISGSVIVVVARGGQAIAPMQLEVERDGPVRRVPEGATAKPSATP